MTTRTIARPDYRLTHGDGGWNWGDACCFVPMILFFFFIFAGIGGAFGRRSHPKETP